MAKKKQAAPKKKSAAKKSAPAKRSVATTPSKTQVSTAKKATSPTQGIAQALAQSNKARSSSQPLNAVSSFGMMVRFFATFFVVNAVVLYIANMVAPQAVVLGTDLLSPFMALLYSTGVFTLLTVAVVPFIEMTGNALNIKLETPHWIAIYAVINTAFLWVVGRLAVQLGLGLSAWYVALILGVILDFIQGFAIQMTGPKEA